MKLQKIVSRLLKLHPKEIDLSLNRIIGLCEKLGNPQNKIKAISVVGTNGKYSTIQAMYAILKQTKFKCNIYTSPHIKKINELEIIPDSNFRISFIFIYLNIVLYDFNRYNITTDIEGKIKYDIKL